VIIYPAIDIRGGRAVQLVEGDFSREMQFDADPVDAALRWQDQGAAWIHIVDLDGARDGIRQNEAAIARIRAAVDVKLQLGGGHRDLASIAASQALGIDRMVVGSAAISNPELVPAAVAAFGDAIAVGLDAREGMVATRGWLEQTSIPALEVASRVANEGVGHIIFTDIGRDGRLEGPNLDALRQVIAGTGAGVIASGGISSPSDVAAVLETGATGVIIGTALYKGAVSLPEALAIAAAGPASRLVTSNDGEPR
jgi:phosphoribosylformimino-5-aminoimidazole carboxamide ribotide isomerase